MRRKLGIVAVLLALTLAGACTSGDPDPDDPAYFGDEQTTTSRAAPSPGVTTGPAATAATGTGRTGAGPAVTGAPARTSAAATRPPASCGVTGGWNTSADDGPGQSTDKLVGVRAARHDCFDRLVFDIDGPAQAGFAVRYVPVVRADGSGEPVPVAGNAAVQVLVRSSIQGYPEGEMLANVGDRFYTAQQLSGWKALREVRFAGFFEGQSTIAVGVREQLPFRAFTLVEGGVRKVIVDIAHQ